MSEVRYSDYLRCLRCRELVLRTMTREVNGLSYCLDCAPVAEEAERARG